MNIKLHARLSAYSKIDSLNSPIPNPSNEDSGSVLGVDEFGKYTLFSATTPADIDTLFDRRSKTSTPSRNIIDNMFKE